MKSDDVYSLAAKLERLERLERDTGLTIEAMYSYFSHSIVKVEYSFNQLIKIEDASLIYDISLTMSTIDTAKNLNRSQCQVSHRVLSLEDRLGFKIFARNGKKYVGLTPEGEAIMPAVLSLLVSAQQLKQIIKEQKK